MMIKPFQKRQFLRFLKRSWILVIFLIAFLVVIIRVVDVSSFSSLGTGIAKGTTAVFNVISYPVTFVKNESIRFRTLKSVNKENEKLAQTIKDKENEIETLQTIVYENESLKRQLGYFKEIKYSKKFGKILFDSQDAYFKTVLIDLGEEDGVKEQQVVLANGYLFGQIIETFKSSSRVLLVSDSNFKTDIVIPRTSFRGFIKGNNNKGAVLYNMESKADIQDGDIVMSNGMNQNFPPNILIGTIKNAKRFQVELYIELKDVTYIEVITETFKGK